MLFLCFSSKDRHTIVEALLYHLDNYAIPIWYDRREMLMSDLRDYKNFVEGVGQCSYAIIILSPNSIASKCANEEITLIKDKYIKGNMTVFPIFYNISADSVPTDYQWMKKLVYKELTPNIDSVGACNHIVCKILLDELKKYPLRSLEKYIHTYKHVPMHSFIIRLIEAYLKTGKGNYNARISLLFSASTYLISYYNQNNIPQYYYEGIEFLFSQTKLSLPFEQRELLIMERLFLLQLNGSMFRRTIQD